MSGNKYSIANAWPFLLISYYLDIQYAPETQCLTWDYFFQRFKSINSIFQILCCCHFKATVPNRTICLSEHKLKSRWIVWCYVNHIDAFECSCLLIAVNENFLQFIAEEICVEDTVSTKNKAVIARFIDEKVLDLFFAQNFLVLWIDKFSMYYCIFPWIFRVLFLSFSLDQTTQIIRNFYSLEIFWFLWQLPKFGILHFRMHDLAIFDDGPVSSHFNRCIRETLL